MRLLLTFMLALAVLTGSASIAFAASVDTTPTLVVLDDASVDALAAAVAAELGDTPLGLAPDTSILATVTVPSPIDVASMPSVSLEATSLVMSADTTLPVSATLAGLHGDSLVAIAITGVLLSGVAGLSIARLLS